MNQNYLIRPINRNDNNWIISLLKERWGSEYIVSKGIKYNISKLLGFIAASGDERVGLITYQIKDSSCEIITLDSILFNKGIGTKLVEAVKNTAVSEKCTKIYCITTNDNLNALEFYQKRGFRIVAVYPDALEKSRKLKPEIPQTGYHHIPLSDEIELELFL